MCLKNCCYQQGRRVCIRPGYGIATQDPWQMNNPSGKQSAEKRKWVFTLRFKVMVIFLALTLAPVLMIGYFSFHFSEKLIVSMVVRQLENTAKDKATLLEGWLKERVADVSMVAETSLVRSMDPERIGPYLDLIREKYGVYKRLAVI